LRAYAAAGTLTVRGPAVEVHYKTLCGRIESQLAGEAHKHDIPPLLSMDAFQFLVQTTMVLSPIRKLEVRHVLQLSLTVELLRVILTFALDSAALVRAGEKLTTDNTRKSLHNLASKETHAIKSVVMWLSSKLQEHDDSSRPDSFRDSIQNLTPEGASDLYTLCRTYSLAFLRKSAILFHVAHGVDFPNTAGSEAGLPELDRLLHLFQLPDILEILLSFDEFSGVNALKTRASSWVQDAIWGVTEPLQDTLGIRLLHPAPFELIGLPKYFDVLMEESHYWKCPTTGKEVSDPALCLFCGEIFCSQTVCCLTKEMRGGCNAHIEKCSSPIGMFLFVRKCHVALLHVVKDPRAAEHDRDRPHRGLQAPTPSSLTLSHGSFFPAPYLTKHGETDSGLRSKHQLILNQKRYDKLLRDTWLMTNGSVWSTIARKLESEVNAGGWETL